MNHKRIETYFISRKSKLIKDFDNLMKRVGTVLVSRYGKEFDETIASEARQEYSKLIPEIPYVGQNRILVQFITGTAQSLPIYRVLGNHGKTLEEAGQLYYLMCKALLDSFPTIVRWLIGKASFSKRASSTVSPTRISPPRITKQFKASVPSNFRTISEYLTVLFQTVGIKRRHDAAPTEILYSDNDVSDVQTLPRPLALC